MLGDDPHTRRDARALKPVARQTEDRFQDSILDEPLTAGFCFAAQNEDALRHDRGPLAVALEGGDPVVGLLRALRHEVPEPILELHALAAVVLRESGMGEQRSKRRISRPSVDRQRLRERVALPEGGAADAVPPQVPLADGPRGARECLPGQFTVARVAADFRDVLCRREQPAARIAGGIVDRPAYLRLDPRDQEPDDLGGRGELAALLAGAVGEVVDEVLVGRKTRRRVRAAGRRLR